MTRIFNQNLLYPDLSYKLTGVFFKIHKKLGRFCSERQYCDEIEKAFKEAGFSFGREYEIRKLEILSPKGNRVDFIVENKILIEVKAKKFVTKEDYIQTVRYLESAGIGLGMIVNFRSTYLKPKRVINAKFDSGNSGVRQLADSGHSSR